MPDRLERGWAIFVSDNLDNGAGYSSAYSVASEFAIVLETAADLIGQFFQSANHADSCTTSCQHCLRHYGNRLNHQALDWRLGLDMVEVLRGKRQTFDLTAPWWARYVTGLLHKRINQITREDWRPEPTALGMAFVSPRGRALIPIHPLVNVEHRTFRKDYSRMYARRCVTTLP